MRPLGDHTGSTSQPTERVRFLWADDAATAGVGLRTAVSEAGECTVEDDDTVDGSLDDLDTVLGSLAGLSPVFGSSGDAPTLVPTLLPSL